MTSSREKDGVVAKAENAVKCFEDGKKGPQAEGETSLEAKKEEKKILPSEPPGKNKPCWHLDLSPVRNTADLQLPERRENKFVLFSTTNLLVICYCSNRK